MKLKCIKRTALALFLICFGVSSIAQTQPTDTIKGKLAQPVTVTMGLTTVDNFVKELSKQTGVPMRAETYLKEHQLSVCMSGVSAKSALNSICEMQHWRWIVSKGTEILVTHRLTVFPTNLSEYPKAYRSVFPVAWLPYLGEGVNPDRAISEQSRKGLEENVRNQHPGQYVEPDQTDMEVTKSIPPQFVRSDMKRRLETGTVGNDVLPTLFPKIRADFKPNSRIPYSQWTEEERNSTLRLIMLKFIYSQLSNIKEDIMAGQVFWFIEKPELGAIAMREGMLLFGARKIDTNGNGTESYVAERVEAPPKKGN